MCFNLFVHGKIKSWLKTTYSRQKPHWSALACDKNNHSTLDSYSRWICEHLNWYSKVKNHQLYLLWKQKLPIHSNKREIRNLSKIRSANLRKKHRIWYLIQKPKLHDFRINVSSFVKLTCHTDVIAIQYVHLPSYQNISFKKNRK